MPIILWPVIIIAIVAIALFPQPKLECVSRSKVVTVGGCNRDGNCGVKLEDGSFTNAYFPVVGVSVCTHYNR